MADDNPFDDIERDLRPRMDDLGAKMEAQVRDWIGVPVGRSGGHIIRSQPGEHPRRETGRLRGSIDHATDSQNGIITVTIDSDVFYAPLLENGTSKMAKRPILTGLLELFEPQLEEIVAEVVAGE
jgi:hypothetical protein